MLTKTKRLIITGIVAYLLIIAGQVEYAIYDNLPVSATNNYAFNYLFDTVQPYGSDETMIGSIAIFLLLPIIGSGLAIYIKNNHELYSVIGRTGWKSFFKKCMGYTFWGATGLYWLGCLLEILMINTFYHPFIYTAFSNDILQGGYGYFSLNSLANLLIKIILNGIGWGIYALFILSVALFINKVSIALSLGPVIGFVIILQERFAPDVGRVLTNISNIWDITNITNPLEKGIAGLPTPAIYYLNYVTTAVFYIALTAVLLRLWYVKNVERG